VDHRHLRSERLEERPGDRRSSTVGGIHHHPYTFECARRQRGQKQLDVAVASSRVDARHGRHRDLCRHRASLASRRRSSSAGHLVPPRFTSFYAIVGRRVVRRRDHDPVPYPRDRGAGATPPVSGARPPNAPRRPQPPTRRLANRPAPAWRRVCRPPAGPPAAASRRAGAPPGRRPVAQSGAVQRILERHAPHSVGPEEPSGHRRLPPRESLRAGVISTMTRTASGSTIRIRGWGERTATSVSTGESAPSTLTGPWEPPVASRAGGADR